MTHRCHDRRFLLRTIRERNDYRKWLRHGARRCGVPVYNYSVTANHVHVIAHVDDADAVSSMMQLARRELAPEAAWTEALAVGDRVFVERAAGTMSRRRRFTYSDAGTGTPNAVCVREASGPYRSKNA